MQVSRGLHESFDYYAATSGREIEVCKYVEGRREREGGRREEGEDGGRERGRREKERERERERARERASVRACVHSYTPQSLHWNLEN